MHVCIGFPYICVLYTRYCSIYYVLDFLKMMLSEAFWYGMILIFFMCEFSGIKIEGFFLVLKAKLAS